MKIGIIDLCKQIEDPSMNRKKVHKMETSIYIFIAAVIFEVQSWNEIEEFEQILPLEQFFKYHFSSATSEKKEEGRPLMKKFIGTWQKTIESWTRKCPHFLP